MSEKQTIPALRALHDSLESALAGQTEVYVQWGPQLAGDDSSAAAALRAAGASWSWVALGFSGRSFWNLHVGVLPVDSGYSVGLHWTPAVDEEVRRWAPAVVPGGTVQFAETAGEYQTLCVDAKGDTVHGAESAVELALRVASRVPRSTTGDGECR